VSSGDPLLTRHPIATLLFLPPPSRVVGALFGSAIFSYRRNKPIYRARTTCTALSLASFFVDSPAASPPQPSPFSATSRGQGSYSGGPLVMIFLHHAAALGPPESSIGNFLTNHHSPHAPSLNIFFPLLPGFTARDDSIADCQVDLLRCLTPLPAVTWFYPLIFP